MVALSNQYKSLAAAPDPQVQRVVHIEAEGAHTQHHHVEIPNVALPDALRHERAMVVVVLDADIAFGTMIHGLWHEVHAAVAVPE